MSNATVKRLLHVEDDPMQQRLLIHHLRSIADIHFETVPVDSEDRAVEVFQKGGIDLVVIDYQLAQGNGLSLLQRLRKLDSIVPIIAVSGVATADVAAELVRAGADDYINKQDLSGARLSLSVRNAMLRAETVRRRLPKSIVVVHVRIIDRLYELCEYFSDRLGAEMAQRLEVLADELRRAELGAADIAEIYRNACLKMEAKDGAASIPAQLAYRPLLLELLARVVGDP